MPLSWAPRLPIGGRTAGPQRRSPPGAPLDPTPRWAGPRPAPRAPSRPQGPQARPGRRGAEADGRAGQGRPATPGPPPSRPPRSRLDSLRGQRRVQQQRTSQRRLPGRRPVFRTGHGSQARVRERLEPGGGKVQASPVVRHRLCDGEPCDMRRRLFIAAGSAAVVGLVLGLVLVRLGPSRHRTLPSSLVTPTTTAPTLSTSSDPRSAATPATQLRSTAWWTP